MSRADQEGHIRKCYDLIQRYEDIRRLSSDPKEQDRAQLNIQEQWGLIRGYLKEYLPLPGPIPLDIAQIAAHFQDRSGQPLPGPGGSSTLPLPPQPYLAHPYPLQEHFTGRRPERQLLTTWLTQGNRPVLALIALGGMGKSALTWAWLQRDLLHRPLPDEPPDACPDPACQVPAELRPQGLLWWSFYEREAGFSSFLDKGLLYASGGRVHPQSLPSSHDKVDALLHLLQQHRILLVLDGLERALRAYAGMGAAYQGDEIKRDEHEEYRACTDPHLAHLLRGAASLPLRGRLLLTSRLLPRELDGLAGCRRENLTALAPADAVAFFRAHQVRGSHAELDAAGQVYGYHPLALRLLAGLIVRDKRRPGDIWVAGRYPVLPKLEGKEQHHILEVSYDALARRERELLSRIAAFRSPTDYEAVTVLNPYRSERPFEAALDELLDRGLLLLDREGARYDLHPVVRRYAYERLSGKPALHGQLRDYFAALPPPERIETLEDLLPTVELYHHTVRAGQHDEACDLYRDRLSDPLYYRLGAYSTTIELLSALFAGGEPLDTGGQVTRLQIKSADDQAWTLNSLSNSYSLSGRPDRVVPLLKLSITIDEQQGDKESVAIGRGNLALAQLPLGRLAEAEGNLRRSIELCREIGDDFWESVGHQELGRLLAYCGRFEEAAGELDQALVTWEGQHNTQSQGIVWAYRALHALLRGEPQAALRAAERAQELAEEDARTDYPIERDFIQAAWLRGAALTALADRAPRPSAAGQSTPQPGEVGAIPRGCPPGQVQDVPPPSSIERIPGDQGGGGERSREALLARAEKDLADALDRCRRINLVEFEPQILLALSRWHRARGEGGPARERAQEALVLADRCAYRLDQADAHNLLAHLALAAGERERALQHARKARERAHCDGPPHAYQVALEEAEGLLESLER